MKIQHLLTFSIFSIFLVGAIQPKDDPQMISSDDWNTLDEQLLINQFVDAFKKDRRLRRHHNILIWNFKNLTGENIDTTLFREKLKQALLNEKKTKHKNFKLKGFATLILEGHIELQVKQVDNQINKVYKILLRATETAGTRKFPRQIWSQHVTIARSIMVPNSYIGSP